MKAVWIAIAALASTAASAQEAYYWPAPARADGMRYTEFPMGTPLSLVTRTEVNSKQATPGDRVYLEVAESLSYRGQVVVPVGSPAVAEVARSERNGHFGKRGAVELRLLYVETPSGPVRLTGRIAEHGKGQGLLSIGGAVLIGGWAPLLIHGTSGYIRQGTTVAAYTAEPLHFVQAAPEVQTAANSVQPDGARSLPASFDPSVFSRGPGFASR